MSNQILEPITPERLREVRLAMGLTQDEMAKKMSVSRTHYNQVESGKQPISKGFAAAANLVVSEYSQPRAPAAGEEEKLLASQFIELMMPHYNLMPSVERIIFLRAIAHFFPGDHPAVIEAAGLLTALLAFERQQAQFLFAAKGGH